MKNSTAVELLDKNPQLAHELHLMTGSQMHFAQQQVGIIDNSINPNIIYDSTITKRTNGQYKYQDVTRIDLQERLQGYLNKQYLAMDKQLYNKPQNRTQVEEGTLALKRLNLREWNKISDILDHSKAKPETISTQDFNQFNNDTQSKNISAKPKKKHHKVKDTKNLYDDIQFSKDMGTDVTSHTVKPIATNGIKDTGLLKSIALKVNPAVISGLVVAKQISDSIRHHDKNSYDLRNNPHIIQAKHAKPVQQKRRKRYLQSKYNHDNQSFSH